MLLGDTRAPQAIARWYFALQGGAGVLWWILVFAAEPVRRATLGGWDPRWVAGPDLVLFAGASLVAAAARPAIARPIAAVATAWTALIAVALTTYGLVEQRAGYGVVAMAAATIGSLAACSLLWFGKVPTRWFFIGPFAFRVASEASALTHLRRSLIQLVIFWTFFFGVVPVALAALEQRLAIAWTVFDHRAVTVAAAVAFMLASALGLWSCITMATLGNGTPLPAQTARDLVISGPYRWVRNPMAVAGVVQTTAVGLALGSWTVVAAALAGALIWNELIRPSEEADLHERFGPQYQSYATQVRCWVPRHSVREYSGD